MRIAFSLFFVTQILEEFQKKPSALYTNLDTKPFYSPIEGLPCHR